MIYVAMFFCIASCILCHWYMRWISKSVEANLESNKKVVAMLRESVQRDRQFTHTLRGFIHQVKQFRAQVEELRRLHLGEDEDGN